MRQILQNLGSGETTLAVCPAPACVPGSVLIRTCASLISAGTERMLVEFSQGSLVQKARSQPDRVKQVLDKIKTDGLVPTLKAVFRKLDEPLPLGYCNVGRAIECGVRNAEWGVAETRDHGPRTTDHGPRTTDHGLRTTDHGLRTTDYGLRTTDYGLRTTDYGLRTTDQRAEGRIGVGDRVVSNGPHAEFVCVPGSLCARIPDGVSDEEAAFTVLGAIALQGMRLANPTFGERFMVLGLGLIGLLAVQLLRANGCEVLGVDLNHERLRLAEGFGAAVVDAGAGADVAAAAQAWSGGAGVDGVLVTASAKTDELMHQAAEACRKRGRIVLVGVVGLNLRRDDFYKKELTFQVSCSYGPGRYDEKYEQGGQDYPLPYVRWTEQRNFEAVLGAMKSRALNVKPLITHRFKLDDAVSAYDVIQKDPSALGVILQYPEAADASPAVLITPRPSTLHPRLSTLDSPLSTLHPQLSPLAPRPPSLAPRPPSLPPPAVGVIGAGNFAKAILMPALARTPASLLCVADLAPAAAAHLARKFKFEQAATAYKVILQDARIKAVFIVTGHNTHARFVCEALKAGKSVFVEKPLCLNGEELDQIIAAYTPPSALATPHSALRTPHSAGSSLVPRPSPSVSSPSSVVGSPQSSAPHLMVGFNRRFSPHTAKLRGLLAGRREPLCLNMTVNAGAIPADHWVQDPKRGGGRIIGEACHFIDLLSHLAGAPVTSVSARMVGPGSEVRADKMSIQLGFADGSIGTVNYFANGAKSYPKEVLEVFSEGRIARVENFRATLGYGFKGFQKFKTWRQDKGHNQEIAAFVERVARGGQPLIPFAELENATRASFAAMESALSGQTVRL